jgi:hypothetical protein
MLRTLGGGVSLKAEGEGEAYGSADLQAERECKEGKRGRMERKGWDRARGNVRDIQTIMRKEPQYFPYPCILNFSDLDYFVSGH